MKTKKRKVLFELLIWFAFLSVQFAQFNILTPLIIDNHLNPKGWAFVISNSFLICFYYFNIKFALPKLLFNKKRIQFIVIQVVFIALCNFVFYAFPSLNPLEKIIPTPNLFFSWFISIRLAVMLLFSFVIFISKRTREAEKNRMQTEIYSLRSQINPHFLFNTLNNIYALTLVKSDKAGESIIMLSSIMRYMINEQHSDLISLRKEMDYLNSYLELEKLRIPTNVDLDIKIEGNLNKNTIAPLIFLPFIENAFKHGISTEKNTHIQIHLTIVDDLLYLLVKNKKINNPKIEIGGFGLKNVIKRLDLLYANKYDLQIIDHETTYTVNLKLNLNA
jgi:LytS/YehU family sensor histidine kinase